MSNPKTLRAQIQQEESELAKLQTEEQRLNAQRRELLLKSVLAGDDEHRLLEIEARLLTIHNQRDQLRSRIAERQDMLPELKREQGEAEKRLQDLKKEITPLAKELMDADTETAALYNRALERQQRVNDLEQKLTEWVTEAQYLAKRFDLDGAGLRVPGRYHYDGVWQRIRVLAAFTPTRPADYTDKLKTLDRERNVREKQERRQALELQARGEMKLAG